MRNVAKVLKEEIVRIGRKEVKGTIADIGKSQTNLKKVVADLRKRVASLEKQTKSLIGQAKKPKPAPDAAPAEEAGKARFTGKGIRSLRSKLRLTQAEFAKLVAATPHAVYLWEKKEGALSLREKTKKALLSVRGMGAKDAKAKLEGGGGKSAS